MLPIARAGATGEAVGMDQWMDAGALADVLTSHGIQPAITARVARSVLSSGVAAVAALGPGAFPSWGAATSVSLLVQRAFDEGYSGKQIAMRLAEAAGVQKATRDGAA